MSFDQIRSSTEAAGLSVLWALEERISNEVSDIWAPAGTGIKVAHITTIPWPWIFGFRQGHLTPCISIGFAPRICCGTEAAFWISGLSKIHVPGSTRASCGHPPIAHSAVVWHLSIHAIVQQLGITAARQDTFEIAPAVRQGPPVYRRLKFHAGVT
ncbi:hypothetical protein DFP72DRAFT_553201 [Ephemerocybe angulata]|uniref:Uncharacterized protein n=1 Tax=Ephemerocybe angulata TaxID=980116 RepID=A0A8H6HL38_9AGAR|nr:hypothetical protein DFP72DRAFT_553201 [Tulosesus angulatus]